jgi:2-succinyl-5-enolpyruvyl-6-hydroxy-3-cyclohexene-1-carboxylate synthase
MPLDFRNVNSLWASVAIETLARLGLQTAVVCPGSRSTPLTLAFAAHPHIEALPVLDERSAAFFALGCVKRQHRPVALVCTSGTAGANFYPAIIEAYESGLPLLVFTADRPPEMRDCSSGQTIDQQKLYGGFVKQYSELAVPVATPQMLAYLRQTLVSAWQNAILPVAGPIHFNCPFRDPLPPIADSETQQSTQALSKTLEIEQFFQSVLPVAARSLAVEPTLLPLETWQQCSSGLIIAGPTSPQNPETYCKAISQIANALNWPVLAEGLSPLRNYQALNHSLISTYDIILRNSAHSKNLIPQNVLQLGPLPTSKVLREWLQTHSPQRWIIGSKRNVDPLHGPTISLPLMVETLAETLAAHLQTEHLQTEHLLTRENRKVVSNPQSEQQSYKQQWIDIETSVSDHLKTTLTKESALVESKIVWLLSQHLPESTPLFISNSMPVRDVEYFWPRNNRRIQPVFSRGANGIDGTLSTAMGLAHHNRPTVLLTGDLAFLHDTNGLLNRPQLVGHLTIVLINNQGGGIFEMLPVSQFGPQFEPVFEKYFVTPQQVNLAALCEAYGVAYELVETVEGFVTCVEKLPHDGMRLVEVVCDRAQSVQQRKRLLRGYLRG